MEQVQILMEKENRMFGFIHFLLDKFTELISCYLNNN